MIYSDKCVNRDNSCCQNWCTRDFSIEDQMAQIPNEDSGHEWVLVYSLNQPYCCLNHFIVIAWSPEPLHHLFSPRSGSKPNPSQPLSLSNLLGPEGQSCHCKFQMQTEKEKSKIAWGEELQKGLFLTILYEWLTLFSELKLVATVENGGRRIFQNTTRNIR